MVALSGLGWSVSSWAAATLAGEVQAACGGGHDGTVGRTADTYVRRLRRPGGSRIVGSRRCSGGCGTRAARPTDGGAREVSGVPGVGVAGGRAHWSAGVAGTGSGPLGDRGDDVRGRRLACRGTAPGGGVVRGGRPCAVAVAPHGVPSGGGRTSRSSSGRKGLTSVGWTPWGAVRRDGLPQVGALVAWAHQVWSVVRVLRTVPPSAPEDIPGVSTHRVLLQAYTGVPGERWEDTHCYAWWWTYPDGHYPVCQGCGEPSPCREYVAAVTARCEMARMERFECPDRCPGCGAPVRCGEPTVTFPDNVYVPGGPPVTFHAARPDCVAEARCYEQRWLAGDTSRHPMLP